MRGLRIDCSEPAAEIGNGRTVIEASPGSKMSANLHLVRRASGPMRTLAGLCLLQVLASGQAVFAQQPSQGSAAQALTASVSNFGTSFVFSPPPICAGCVESELGLLSVNNGQLLPAVLSFGPFATHTDFNVLVNVLDSQMTNGRRTTHFGDRFDFVVRQQLLQRGGIVLTLAPRGAVLTRDGEGGRAGATVGVAYGKGKSLGVINLTDTARVGSSPDNPKNDYQSAFDYYRTINPKGYAVFAGLLHEVATGNPQTVSIEEGLIIPFRNGQVELATQQLNVNVRVTWQFQARVTANWGRLLRR